MADDSDPTPPETDLLGRPWRELPDPRGRKKLVFAPEVYEKVEELRALGMEVGEIADALGISDKSVRKYFFRELNKAAARVKAEVLGSLMEQVRAGKIAAIREALSRLDRGAAIPSIAPSKSKVEKLGKKAAADAEAHTAHEGSEWGSLLN